MIVLILNDQVGLMGHVLVFEFNNQHNLGGGELNSGTYTLPF